MVSANPAATPVSTKNLGGGGELLCSAVDCGGVDPAVMAATVFAATTLALLALATFVHISKGVSLVDAERHRTGAETRAMERFAVRVEGLEPSAVRAGQVQHGEMTLVSTSSEDPKLGEARRAYRETVMAVPHYDDEYDESLAANMAAEFGEDVATAVVAGSGFTPALKQELVRRSREAATHRRALLRTLSRESEALSASRCRLDGMESRLDSLDDCRYREPSFGELQGRWDRLAALESDCEEFLADRQRTLHRRTPGPESVPFYDYVYRPLSVSFPVLADGLALLERIRDAERSVVRALASRT